MKNILISTTCNWNIGDEVIRKGVENLLRLKMPKSKYNFIPYNRNPDLFVDYPQIRYPRENTIGNYWTSVPKNIDAIVLAGSPEWTGQPLEPIYRHVRAENTPLLALGVGYSFKGLKLSSVEKNAWENESNAITFRAKEVANEFEKITGRKEQHLTCPSVFAIDPLKLKPARKGIGYFIQSPGKLNQQVSQKAHDDALVKFSEKGGTMFAYYKKDFDYWCEQGLRPHWIETVDQLLDTINNLQEIHTTRLHTALPAMYAGVNTHFYGDDYRTKTALTNLQSYDTLGPAYIKVIEQWLEKNKL